MATVDRTHFGKVIVTMAESYGLVELKQSRLEIYWDKLSAFDEELFDKVVKAMYENLNHFPMISDFHDFAHTFHKQIDGSFRPLQ